MSNNANCPFIDERAEKFCVYVVRQFFECERVHGIVGARALRSAPCELISRYDSRSARFGVIS